MLVQNLFTEICKRGCYIETTYKCCTKYLPECLVVYNEYFVDENSDEDEWYDYKRYNFKIKCLKQSSLYVGISKSKAYVFNSSKYDYFAHYLSKSPASIACESNNTINFGELDRITHYLYNDGDVPYYWNGIYSKKPIIPINIMNTYKQYLRYSMTRSLNKYLEVFYVLPLFKEIKSIIITNMIMIDNWNSVGFPTFQ